MLAADLGGGAAPPDGRRRSAPLARISLRTVTANARIAVATTRVAGPTVVDLRADARGHGAAEVARALRDAGVDGIRVDAADAAALADAGAAGITTTAPPTLDTATVFGLPGGAAGSLPALQLVGTVLAIKLLRAGEGVSYGYTHRASADTRIALVTGGYAQGIVRSLGNRAEVAVGRRRHGIVGRVAMDVCVIDIGDDDAERGDDAVFLGDPAAGEPTLAEWAGLTGLTAAELVTAVGRHSAREYVR